MKLRHWIWAAVALVLLATMILPAAVYRHRWEVKNDYYTAAVDASLYSNHYPMEELVPFFREMKAAGASAAVVREGANGYSEAVLSAATEAGLSIVPEPDVRNASFHELEKLVKDWEVEALKLHVNLWSEREEPPEKRAEICRLIREQDLILVLTETAEHLSNYHPEGFEEYLAAAEGRVMRCYQSISNTHPNQRDYPYLYYHYLGAVLDRNIRFLLATPLQDEDFSPGKNLELAVESMTLLCQKLEAEGYSASPDPDLSAYPPKRALPSAAVAAIWMLMVAVLLDLLLKGTKKWLLPASLIAAGGTFGLTFLLPEAVVLLYPSVNALLASCFCIGLVYEFLNAFGERPLPWRVLLGCGLAFLLLLLSGLCQASMMNGRDYWLNEKAFSGVKPALILPILFGALWPLRTEWRRLRPRAIGQTLGGFLRGLRWYHGLGFLAAAGLLGLYLLRSGNVSSISFLETRLRDGLTELLLARPRTKEFLFGWPCLMLLIYEQSRKGGSKLFCWILSAVAAVLFASGINTFCHAFTPIATMALRLVYGMLGGLLIGMLFLGIYMGFLRLYGRIKRLKMERYK